MNRLLRATGRALRAVCVPLAALLIFAVLASITVFALWVLVALSEGFS